MIRARHNGSFVEREGRGYSWKELAEAGIALASAGGMRVPVDGRRRSLVQANAEMLKSWAQRTAPASLVRKDRPGKKK